MLWVGGRMAVGARQGQEVTRKRAARPRRGRPPRVIARGGGALASARGLLWLRAARQQPSIRARRNKMAPSARQRPRLGWRWNEELETRNAALERALEQVSAGSQTTLTRQEQLEKLLADFLSARDENDGMHEFGNEDHGSLACSDGHGAPADTHVTCADDDASHTSSSHQRSELQARVAMLQDEIGGARERGALAQRRLLSEQRTREATEASISRHIRWLRAARARDRWRLFGTQLALRSTGRRFVTIDVQHNIAHAISARWQRPSKRDSQQSPTSTPSARRGQTTEARTSHLLQWSLDAWLESLPLAKLIAGAIRRRLVGDGANLDPEHERAFLMSLADENDPRSLGADASDTLAAMLEEAHVAGLLADEMSQQATALLRQRRRAAAARRRQHYFERSRTAKPMHEPHMADGGDGSSDTASGGRRERDGQRPPKPLPVGPGAEAECANPSMGKFVDDTPSFGADGDDLKGSEASPGSGGFELVYGDIKDFSRGLVALVGPPSSGDALLAMGAEHCDREDSRTEFVVGNYGTTTFALAEWYFVVDPSLTGLGLTGLATWPRETRLCAAGCTVEEAEAAEARRRVPRSLDEFETKRSLIDHKLGALTGLRFGRFELIGARLYTGPMFVKYNGVLRGIKPTAPAPFRERLRALCPGGNLYAATLHVINAALVSLGQLTVCSPVYRGVGGGRLPAAFVDTDEFGCRGGCEFGFMSTTHDRHVAIEYAEGSLGVVLEVEQGAVARGADLSWLSQYPHEAEITFPPLTMLEVAGMHVEGTVTICNVRPSISRANEADAIEVCAAQTEEEGCSGESQAIASESVGGAGCGCGMGSPTVPSPAGHASHTQSPDQLVKRGDDSAAARAARRTSRAGTSADPARKALLEKAIQLTRQASVELWHAADGEPAEGTSKPVLAPATRRALSMPRLL